MNCNIASKKSFSFNPAGLGCLIVGAAMLLLGGFALAAAHAPRPRAASPADGHAPVVTLRRVHAPALHRHGVSQAVLVFRVRAGYHINSNHPNSSFLIPTTLRFAGHGKGIEVRAIRWPRPHELKFQFAAQPLSVFSGTFPVRVDLRAGAGAGTQVLAGTLQYQACNDTLCRPPATLPVQLRLHVK